MLSATTTAPVNIAVIKYWGKRNEELVLPINSSLSVTLDQQQLCTKTTVAASKAFTEDRLWLNGHEESLKSERYQNVLTTVRRRARKRKTPGEDHHLLNWHVHICSENNFPTAAGLASSAAGFACLVYGLAKLYKVEGDLSAIARLGSGSACRSVLGGFVAWDMGTMEDGSDSLARQIAPPSHWPNLRILILVVNASKKAVGSSAGMQTSVQTSSLLEERARHIPDKMKQMEEAIKQQDFQTFAEITMKESNNMHAVCLDTYPPLSYMSDTSRHIQHVIHAINDHHGQNKVAYTYDAGPNACLYLLEESVAMVLGMLLHVYPCQDSDKVKYVRGLQVIEEPPPENLLSSLKVEPLPGAISYMIHTKVGAGPQVLDSSQSLLDETGQPKDNANNLC